MVNIGLGSADEAGHRATLCEFFLRSSRGGHRVANDNDDAPLLSEMQAGGTGEGIKDLLREVVRDALRDLIEKELTVAIAERPALPMIRSPSQWPGTA